MSETSDEGPDLDKISFSLRDLRWAQKEGREQGIRDTLTLVDAGATTAYIREHLLTDEDPERVKA